MNSSYHFTAATHTAAELEAEVSRLNALAADYTAQAAEVYGTLKLADAMNNTPAQQRYEALNAQAIEAEGMARRVAREIAKAQ